MAKRGLSSKQWAKTLIAAMLLVVVLLAIMLQLTDSGQSDAETGGQMVEAEPPSEAAPAAPAAQETVPKEEEPPAEQLAEQSAATEPPEPDQQAEPAEALANPSDVLAETEAKPPDDQPPATPPDALPETETSQPPPDVSETVPPALPDGSQEAALRERLQGRLAALDEAVRAAAERQEKPTPAPATTKMAEAMKASLAAQERVAEAADDLVAAESLDTPQADALQAELAEDEQQQTQAAEVLANEFEALKMQAAEPVEPPAAYQGTSRVGEVVVEHRAQAVMSATEAQALLNAVGEDDVLFIRSLRWNGQAKAARDLWIRLGATYALLPPHGSFDPIYRVAAPLRADSALARMEQDDFFARFSNRFTFLTTGDDAQAIKRFETRLLRSCGTCAGYRLSLVWNWQTLAVILSDAKALAHSSGLHLPEDVKIIDWLAVPGAGANRARIDVVKLIARDGEEHGP